MKLILYEDNSHPVTITVKGRDLKLLLIETSILIDCSQIAELFDKKERTVSSKVQKSKIRKYEVANIKMLKHYGFIHPDAVKSKPFYDLRQMMEGPAYYYFEKAGESDLIEVIIRTAIGKHREWLHNREIDK